MSVNLQTTSDLLIHFLKKSYVNINDVCKFTDYFRFTDSIFKNASINLKFKWGSSEIEGGGG